ncbi:VWA domain-containing protein [Halieaceae bacterium IMCC14734]|uniref:VWA domain-containing protein n=1 Tax=Candidatus Litorirhabdus singularis TaxID=2518993 RepID=A0ABT3TK29_9GAMM|nr:vWA domain-containing protein [Candidatus Litorirhabdus singularis]MCX2982644.1 VWA domain-containing protein [Candidatus Litorirhabdus singularis]
MARRRSNIAFNLSFLDVMSCGFGAVILVFLIIDHAIEEETRVLNTDLLSEVNMLEVEIKEGKEGLVQLRNTLSDVDFDMVEAKGLAMRISEQIDEFRALIESLSSDGFTERSEVETLMAEIQQLEEEVKKLRASSDDSGGISARTFIGDGNRQYLTGLNLGGRNILILVDVSASMLAQELVNVIRLRNMSDDIKRNAEKWKRSVATVEWLTAQLPVSSQYQIYTFNTQAAPLLPGTEGSWLEVGDQEQLEKSTTLLQELVPADGTSLENAFLAAVKLSPKPDNIFLITDGLPTQGASGPRGSKINGRERLRLFERAVAQLPRSVPVNVILAPMEGDPMAASALWQLAQATSGAFMSPSRDWP